MEKNTEYFEKQIKGLLIIMEDAPEKEVMVARSYVKEKLKMILSNGINFHPDIKDNLITSKGSFDKLMDKLNDIDERVSNVETKIDELK